ncbi:hypothetical protein ACP70R_014754 [Stipagrostis hirtigluma subsp. patula]
MAKAVTTMHKALAVVLLVSFSVLRPPSPFFSAAAAAAAAPPTFAELAEGNRPETCIGELAPMLDCGNYITDVTLSLRPPSVRCCNGLRQVVNGTGIICLCHVLDSDFGSYLTPPRPVNLIILMGDYTANGISVAAGAATVTSFGAASVRINDEKKRGKTGI